MLLLVALVVTVVSIAVAYAVGRFVHSAWNIYICTVRIVLDSSNTGFRHLYFTN
jgi:hypothetical protein